MTISTIRALFISFLVGSMSFAASSSTPAFRDALVQCHAAYVRYERSAQELAEVTNRREFLEKQMGEASVKARLIELRDNVQAAAGSYNTTAHEFLEQSLSAKRGDSLAQAAMTILLSQSFDSRHRVALLTDAARRDADMLDALVAQLYAHVAYEWTQQGGVPRQLQAFANAIQSEASVRKVSPISNAFYDLDFADFLQSYSSSVKPDERYRFLLFALRLADCCCREGRLGKTIFATVESRLTDADFENHQTDTLNHFLFQARKDWEQDLRMDQLDARIARLEEWRGKAAVQIASLETATTLLETRVNALEGWKKDVDFRLEDHERRLNRIETWLENGDLSAQVEDELLQRFAPTFLHDDFTSGPVVSPSEFANGCDFGEPHPKKLPEWSASDLLSWLKDGPNATVNRASSATRELAPLAWRRKNLTPSQVREYNERAVREGLGIFGAVRKLKSDDHVYSVKYFLFSAWNETHFPGGEGNHEGDWACVDFQVRGEFRREGSPNWQLLYGIFHYHGKQEFAPVDGATKLEFDKDGQPLVYLEAGANEAHPHAGDDDYFEAIRPHGGNGLKYPTKGKVRNIRVANDDDSQLVRLWQGEWGELDVDECKWLFGDVTNPRGPLYQEKMWDRSFSNYPDDPMPR